jgi:hypothetical protein
MRVNTNKSLEITPLFGEFFFYIQPNRLIFAALKIKP